MALAVAKAVAEKKGYSGPASGWLAGADAAKAAADGHTLGVSIVGPLVINPLIMASVPYDPDKELAPISIVATPGSL